MKLKQLFALAFLLSLLLAVAFGLTAFLVSEDKFTRFDQEVVSFIQGYESFAWTRVMKFFTWMGSGMVVTVLSVLMVVIFSKMLKHRSELVLFVVVVSGAGILNQILKSLFHRVRPSLHLLIEAGGFSFPSGHTMEAVAFYGIVTFLFWRYIDSRWAKEFCFLSVSS